jgi:hypothetical protein
LVSGAGVLLAAAVLLWQGEGPALHAAVDMDRVSVGEELTYSLRAVSRSPVPMQVTVAPFNGLEIVSRTERTEVSLGTTPTRTTLLEVRLRAVRPGRWQLGPARAVQGRDTTEADALIVDVAANRAATASTLNPRLRQLLERARPPDLGGASVNLLVSADSARVGEQVDVVTTAWFPRDLRLQLRRPPTLQPPVIDGVWTYPQATPSGIAATRNVGGRWYDLFVAHQVVFPLVPGTVTIPRATLKYSTPVALQFFSQEERYALTSRAETLLVRPLPAEGRPGDFNGAVASGLKIDRRITPQAARVGEGITVELSLAGEGNTALWPAPDIHWPAGSRAYSDRVEERLSTAEGRIGGTKVFRYLVVPDSAGALTLPATSYAYYDLASHRYTTLTLPAGSVPVALASETAASAALPPALISDAGEGLARQLVGRYPIWVWLLVLAAPPAVLMLRGRLPARRLRQRSESVTDLGAAEQELDAVLRTLLPDPDQRSGAHLRAAMTAAGANADLAVKVAAARERLLSLRYGPAGPRLEDPALAAEVRDLVRRLGGSLRGWAGRGAAAVLLGLACTRPLSAQSPSPEDLYRQGSLAAAAEGFARRAAEEPDVGANWYNLGAAFYRQGLEGRAAAAWTQARRLTPRSDEVRRALRLTPPPDAMSVRWTWSPPVTPEELLLFGSLAWIGGWIGWALRPRVRERWLVLLVFGGIGVAAGLALRAWYSRPLAIVLDRTAARISPHGLAPVVAPLEPGSALRVVSHVPGWVLVRTAGAQHGWVDEAAVARVGG